jgi:membrane-associated phospholipid phosphatase
MDDPHSPETPAVEPGAAPLVGAELAAGLGAAVLAMGLLIWLGDEVLEGETRSVDLWIRGLVHGMASPWLTDLMWGASVFGAPRALAMFGVAAAVVFLAREWRRAAVLVLVTMAGAMVLDVAPPAHGRRVGSVLDFYPAPASTASPAPRSSPPASSAGLRCRVAPAGAPGGRVASLAHRLIAIALIGGSRIYLGHYPTDVLGGIAAGVVWVGAVARTARGRGVAGGGERRCGLPTMGMVRIFYRPARNDQVPVRFAAPGGLRLRERRPTDSAVLTSHRATVRSFLNRAPALPCRRTFMRRLRIGVLDLVTKSQKPSLYGRLMHPNLASIMPQALSVWCEQAGHRVTLCCYTGVEDLLSELPADLDVVFIGAFTQSAQVAYALSQFYRRRGAVTVLGGPHARCYPEDSVRYFDYVLGFTDQAVIAELLQDPAPSGRSAYRWGGPTAAESADAGGAVEVRGSTLAKAPTIKIVDAGSLGCPYTSFCIDSTVEYQPLSFPSPDDLVFLLTR